VRSSISNFLILQELAIKLRKKKDGLMRRKGAIPLLLGWKRKEKKKNKISRSIIYQYFIGKKIASTEDIIITCNVQSLTQANIIASIWKLNP
jgi:hypothetical protein